MKTAIRILVLVLALAAVTAGVMRSGFFKKEDTHTVRLSGNIELTEVDIGFKMPGKLAELLVVEGSEVKKGAVVARLDRVSTERQRDREQAGVTSAQGQVAQMLTAVEYQKESLKGDIAVKTADVRQAQAHLDELLAGSRPQEIEQAQAAVRDARTWHEQARLDWERAQTLFKNEDISKAQYDQYQARFQSTTATVKQAEERLALVKEGPRKETIEGARAQVARAQAALRLAQSNRLEVKRREQELDVRRAEVVRARAQVSVLDSQLDDTIATSPVDGVVLVKSVERGEIIAAGTTIVTIGDLDHPWVRGYINEPDLGRVKLGMKVRLATDSYKGKSYWGRVSFISSQAEFTPKQIQTPEERVKLVYRIKIDVENPAHELKSNMPVDAEILLEQ